jgi:AraC family transcriptional regulator
MQALNDGQYTGNILALASAGGLITSRTQYVANPSKQAMHTHANTHISMFLSGGVVVNRRHEEAEIKPGQVIMFRSDEPHATTGKIHVSNAINLEVQTDFFDRYQIDENRIETVLKKSPCSSLFLLRVLHEMQAGDALSATAIDFLLLNWLGHTKHRKPGKPALWLIRLRDYLDVHWDRNHDLQTLASIANCHPVTIAKYFPRYFGYTLGEYLRRLRANHAVAKIQLGKESLSEIAQACCFSDHSHLTRTIQHFTGYSPSQLRQL